MRWVTKTDKKARIGRRNPITGEYTYIERNVYGFACELCVRMNGTLVTIESLKERGMTVDVYYRRAVCG